VSRRSCGPSWAEPVGTDISRTDGRTSAAQRAGSRWNTADEFATDSPVEEDGFEPSVSIVMDGDLGRQVPALIAVFELAGAAVTLQRGTKVIRPDRHPEFP
jgi:hypothetical protein